MQGSESEDRTALRKIDEMIACLDSSRKGVHSILNALSRYSQPRSSSDPVPGKALAASTEAVMRAMDRMNALAVDPQLNESIARIGADALPNGSEPSIGTLTAHEEWLRGIRKRGVASLRSFDDASDRFFSKPCTQRDAKRQAVGGESGTGPRDSDERMSALSNLLQRLITPATHFSLVGGLTAQADGSVNVHLTCSSIFQVVIGVRPQAADRLSVCRVSCFGMNEVAELDRTSMRAVFKAMNKHVFTVLAHIRNTHEGAVLSTLIKWLDSYHNLFDVCCASSKLRLVMDAETGLIPPVVRSFPSGVPYHNEYAPRDLFDSKLVAPPNGG